MRKFLGLLDMIDGGGAGRSGQAFEGGPLSGLLNGLGIRPMGYMDRLEAARPMARPNPTPMVGAGTPPPAPAMAPPVVGQVAVQPMVGSLTVEDILAAIERGDPQAMPALLDVLAADKQRRDARAVAGFDIATMFPMAAR